MVTRLVGFGHRPDVVRAADSMNLKSRPPPKASWRHVAPYASSSSPWRGRKSLRSERRRTDLGDRLAQVGVELERRRVVPRPGISDSGLGLWDRWLGMTGAARPATHPGPVGAPGPRSPFLPFSVPGLGCPAPAGKVFLDPITPVLGALPGEVSGQGVLPPNF
jgi:hypothetical protein